MNDQNDGLMPPQLEAFQLEFYFIQYKNNNSNTINIFDFDQLRLFRLEWYVAP